MEDGWLGECGGEKEGVELDSRSLLIPQFFQTSSNLALTSTHVLIGVW
jgi:hypothetical protein